MLFNSFAFIIFLPIVYSLYWWLGARRIRAQNALIWVASYIFYGWWDWRFLGLIAGSSLVDFIVGQKMHEATTPKRRRGLLFLSLLVNLGVLGLFKYYNFFIDSFAEILEVIGLQANLPTLRIILPVGISFYTFQTLSYTIDIYRGRLKPTDDFIAFFAFVSFFPQLVAGPIERASALLPQFLKTRVMNWEQAKDGLRQILGGMFKKVVIADNIAGGVNLVFNNYQNFSGLELFLATFGFAIQIYCDFSGYSDIAIGTARLFGFDLTRNFAFPYFSRNIGEFWRRWHISLSTWFRDYVFITLGGNRCALPKHITNIIITFTLSGLWHGSSWNFVIWGLLNGLYYIPMLMMNRQKTYTGSVAENRIFPSLVELRQMLITFGLCLLAWIFFRSTSLEAAFGFIERMGTGPWLVIPSLKKATLLGLGLLFVEWFQRNRKHTLDIQQLRTGPRWVIYTIVFINLLAFQPQTEAAFIYFQF